MRGGAPSPQLMPVAVGTGACFPRSDPVTGETREGWDAGAGPRGPKRTSQKTDDDREPSVPAGAAGRGSMGAKKPVAEDDLCGRFVL